jgi:hypothetical protein
MVRRVLCFAALAIGILTSDLAAQSPGDRGMCALDADCRGAGYSCFDEGRCLCSAALQLCGSDCADLDRDADNCGSCGNECPRGATCSRGQCERADVQGSTVSVIQEAVTVTAPFRVTAFDGTTTCGGDTETAPERAAVAGDARFFAAYNVSHNNWGSTYNSWGTVIRGTPGAVNAGWTTTVLGDPSATTSDFTGLNYVSYLAGRSVDSRRCVGIAVASSDNIDGNVWDFDQGVACIQPGGADDADGPSIKYDLGGTDLYAVDSRNDGLHFHIMSNCRAGQPGCCTNDGSACTSTCTATATEQCPVTFTTT